jgi:hypothetical protein
MTDPLTVVGGSVASLAFSLMSARSGRRVALYVEPTRIGGSFAGIAAAERRFDLGARLFELEYEGMDNARPIAAFDPQRDNHRPYIAVVADFIREILQDNLRPATTPEMWICGSRTRCVLMTVDLSDLPSVLSASARTLVLEQIRQILMGPPRPMAADQTLCDASLAQHGPLLHALLTEAICSKQYQGWRSVLATERRKLWAALFQPKTLFEAFAGLPISFRPHRPFHTTTEGVAYPFVRQLFQAVQGESQITVIPTAALTGLEFDRSGVTRLRFGRDLELCVPGQQCVIGVPPESLFAASGIAYAAERIHASMLWVDVAECDLRSVPSTLMICDPSLTVLRISNSGRKPGWQSFAIEFGNASPDLAAATAALQQTGLVREGAAVRIVHQVSGPAQVAPTMANRIAFETALRGLEPFPGVLLGGARRFGFDGLNDQIADALYHLGATSC